MLCFYDAKKNEVDNECYSYYLINQTDFSDFKLTQLTAHDHVLLDCLQHLDSENFGHEGANHIFCKCESLMFMSRWVKEKKTPAWTDRSIGR